VQDQARNLSVRGDMQRGSGSKTRAKNNYRAISCYALEGIERGKRSRP